jgi:hypothetical protein
LRSTKSTQCHNCAHITHGHSRRKRVSREFNTWRSIISRCECKNHTAYKNYGARGIQICARWRNSFDVFFTDMGPRPKGMQIDRINNSEGYEPGNCRWTTVKINLRNTRRNRQVTWKGETRCVSEWAEIVGLSADTLFKRLDRRGWSIARALTQPLRVIRR